MAALPAIPESDAPSAPSANPAAQVPRRSPVDVIYVHPAKQEAAARYDRYVASPTYPIMPVGVVGLANLLIQNGYRVRGVNVPLEFLLDLQFDLRRWLQAQGQPGVIMVDLHWYEHAFGALDVARVCKAVYPQTPVVLGGLTASRYAGSILAQFPEVDYVIRGDAEAPLLSLVKFLCSPGANPQALSGVTNLAYRDGNKIREIGLKYVAETADLDRLDFVSLGFLEHPEAYGAIQYTGAGFINPAEPRLKGHWLCVGRGCLYNCSYCGGARSAHRTLACREGVVLRSVDRTLGDIRQLAAQGIHQVSLTLDPAIMGDAYWQALLGGMERRGLAIGLYNEFFQLPSQEFLRAFSRVADLSHTEVALSPLSGSERVRRINGKQFSNAELVQTLDLLSELEIPLYVYFSLNLPGETREAFRETLGLAAEICRRYPPELLRMINKCHTLDPVSPMSESPSRYGLRRKFGSFLDYYTYCESTGWQARHVTRGELRGFASVRQPIAEVEQMAQEWDAFAQSQQARCYPVPRGW